MRAFLVALGLSLYPAFAAAMNYAILQHACIRGAIPVPPFDTAPIPVGCEIVDCCPGCPGLGPLEWRIRLDGKIATRAELRFEGMLKEQFAKLKIEGAAKREGERILLSSGSARIGGIPHGAGTPVAVGMLQPLASARAGSHRGATPSGDLPERIVVEQFMGPFLVNSFKWTWVPKPCTEKPKPPPVPAEDRLRVNGIASGDEASVMLFSRTNAGCMDGGSSDSAITFSTTGETWLGNRLSPTASCGSDVSVFSKKHRMVWQPIPWTDALGDTHTVTLEPLIDAALNIWVADALDVPAAEEQAQLAEDLFVANRVGVRLDWKVQVLPPALVQTVDDGVDNDAFAKCLDLAAIRNAMPSIYAASTLNVYYVDKIWAGRNCAIENVPTSCVIVPSSAHAPADANITFIGNDADLTTLVHELGHAYGIRPVGCTGGHASPPDFTPDNIMYPSSTSSTIPRSTLTLGQVFRMNTHGDGWGGTMLIPNAGLPRTPRACFPHLPDGDCPRLTVPWP